MHALTYKTLERIAQISGGVSYNPAVLAAQFASALIQPAPSLQQWINQLRQNQEPGENPAVWMNILLAELAEQKYSSPLVYAETRELLGTKRQIREYPIAFWYDESGFESDAAASSALVKWHDNSKNQVIATATSNGTTKAILAHGSPVIGGDGLKRFGITIGDNQHLTLASGVKVEWAFVVATATGSNGNKGLLLAEGSSKWWGCRQPEPGDQPWVGGMAEGTTYGGRRDIVHGSRAIYGMRYQSEQYLPGISPGHLVALGVNGYDHMSIGNNVTFSCDTLLGYPTTTYDFNGVVYEVIAGASPITEDQYATIERYLAAKWSVTLNPGKRFVLLGDSIGAADGVTGWLTALFGKMNLSAGLVDTDGDTSWNVLNLSYNGNSTVNGSGLNAAYRCAKPTCTRNVLCVHLGTNDLYSGFSLDETIDRLKRIGVTARTSGYDDVWLLPMLSRVGLDTEKNAFNAAAAELEGGEFTKFLDPATIPALCADGAYSSGTNFQDQVHPTTAGHAILAAAVKANMI